MCCTIKRGCSHYLEGNSNIYCCLLDASKAFDRIHYGNLFSTLLSKNMHHLVLRWLVNSSLYKKGRVSRGNHLSQYFTVANGVKQGVYYHRNFLRGILIICWLN